MTHMLQLLSDKADLLLAKPHRKGNVLLFPHHWQEPAATEKAACEAVLKSGGIDDCTYLGFPWATLTDGIRKETAVSGQLMKAAMQIAAWADADLPSRRVSVAQHINAGRYIGLYRACGITDLFWSHALAGQSQIRGVRIHAFPLFPAQTPDGPESGDLHRPRKWLANFIGAYNPKAYLTEVRQRIFDDEGAADLRIIRRVSWHFERAVYDQQMLGAAPDAARLATEELHKAEYLDGIRQSTFTLCPSGSGPNSIRIGEALALGSIPIILTRALAMPGDQELWERACLFGEDSAEGYRDALERARAMSANEIRDRQRATQDLFARIAGPAAWGQLIAQTLQKM